MQKQQCKIAVDIWSRAFGKKIIQKEKPFIAELKNGVWFVRGSLPKGYVGGRLLHQYLRRTVEFWKLVICNNGTADF